MTLSQQSKSTATSTDYKPVELLTLKTAFNPSTERKIGVEIELFIVDAVTEAPMPLFELVLREVSEIVRPHIAGEHLNCQIEIISSPHSSLRELREELQSYIDAVAKVLVGYKAKLMWSGMHPNLRYADELVVDSARTIHNRRQFGALTAQLQTCGVHFHVGTTQDEAIRVIDGMQDYIPLLVALATNSPIMGNEITGRRSQRAAIWASGFPVCGLSGRFGTWEQFNARNAMLVAAGRIEEPKDLYDFVRPTRFSTVEVRCCDLPADLDQVIALAAVVQSLVCYLANEDDREARPIDFLRAELFEASMRGPEARLTDLRGQLVSPQQFLGQLVNVLEPTAMKLRTDLALRMSPAVLVDNGSTRQLNKFQRTAARSPKRLVIERTRRDAWRPIAGFATAASLLIAGGLFAFSAVVTMVA